jgi:hypothetical protein
LSPELERVIGSMIRTSSGERRSLADAAKRATSGPDVLVRPGIGQVLAVGGVPIGELAA